MYISARALTRVFFCKDRRRYLRERELRVNPNLVRVLRVTLRVITRKNLCVRLAQVRGHRTRKNPRAVQGHRFERKWADQLGRVQGVHRQGVTPRHFWARAIVFRIMRAKHILVSLVFETSASFARFFVKPQIVSLTSRQICAQAR